MTLLETQVRIAHTALLLNLACPVTPADRLQFFRTQNQSDRDDHNGNEDFRDNVPGEGSRRGQPRVAEEHGVFVSGVASAKENC